MISLVDEGILNLKNIIGLLNFLVNFFLPKFSKMIFKQKWAEKKNLLDFLAFLPQIFQKRTSFFALWKIIV